MATSQSASSIRERLLDLLDRRGAALGAFAYQLTHDVFLAEDLVQEAVAKVLTAQGRRPTSIGNLEAYLRRVMLREQIDRDTGARVRITLLPDAAWASIPDYREPIDTGALERAVLWSEIGKLPARQRVVLVLRYYQGFTDVEIAAELQWPAGTVRSVASRALATLRRRQHTESSTETEEQR